MKLLHDARKISLSFWLFAAVFFTCSWDLLFKLEVGGFTLKVYQPLALLALAALLWETRKEGIRRQLAPLFSSFASPLLLLGVFYLALSPWSAFPLKSFLYSIWLFFDLAAIYLVAVHLGSRNPTSRFVALAWLTMIFLSYVILVDYVYYYYGFKGGLIGWNQDKITRLGLSRPHAFSSEPSFIATFLCLGLLSTSLSALKLSGKSWRFVLAFLFVLFAMIATTSRTGWASLALGFGMIFVAPLLIGKKIQWKLFGISAGLALAVILLLVATTPPAQKQVLMESFVGSIFRGNDSSGNSRLHAHILAWKIAKKTSFLGTGFAASYKYFKDTGGWDYHAQDAFDEKQYGNEMIMSTWGQLLAEGGLTAVLLYLIAGAALVKALFRRWRTTLDPLAMSSMAGALVYFFFTAFWLGNLNRADVWVWYGIWSAVAYNSPAKAVLEAQAGR